MRAWLRLTSLALGLGFVGAALAAGCAAGDQKTSTQGIGGSGGSGHGSGAAGPGPGSGGSSATFAGSGGNGGNGGGPSCAKFTDEAKALPAAMLIVLDMSASMKVKVNNVPKYVSAAQAIVQAIDNDAFDNTSIGLLTFPDHKVTKPACLTGYPANYQVSCGFPVSPQISISDSGTEKSTDTSGVRHNIATFLQGASPLSSLDDGSPDYEALQGAYAALKATPNVDKRFAILVSDGGFSCTSLSNPTRPGYSDGECPDWEEPDTVNALISGAYADASAPINTFIVGVPGSNTDGGTSGVFANAPYSMLLALSTYAVSGSPDTVDPTCDKTAMFTMGGGAPAHPCHIDLSNGPSFSAQALADAISRVRGQALGCVYDLPTPPPGQQIDPNYVNVILTLNGTSMTIPKRTDPNDMCTSDDCWDYDAMTQVVLVGKACSDLTAATSAKIEIEVGCKTIVK